MKFLYEIEEHGRPLTIRVKASMCMIAFYENMENFKVFSPNRDLYVIELILCSEIQHL